jgi:hypothetical protein
VLYTKRLSPKFLYYKLSESLDDLDAGTFVLNTDSLKPAENFTRAKSFSINGDEDYESYETMAYYYIRNF